MKESDKCSESERNVTYKHIVPGNTLSMSFNKELKCVDIVQMNFQSSGEPILEPMNENVRYSAKHGHWQMVFPCLSIEDIDFLYKKSMELFGR